MNLTDIGIRRMTPPASGSQTHFDDTLPGFGIRITANGIKSFTLVQGKSRKRTHIGRYPVVSLQDARTAAKRLIAERTLGKHRASSTRAVRAVAAFLEAIKQKNAANTHREYERTLNRHFLPAFQDETLDYISPRAILDRLAKIRAPSEKNHAFAVMRTFFRWAVRQHYLDRSPMEVMQMPSATRSRERVLTDQEASNALKLALAATSPFHAIVALLLITGQRRGEIAALEWSWIDRQASTITLPSPITKNRRAHTFPIGPLALGVIDKLDRIGDSPYLFPAARDRSRDKPATVFNGWGKPKAAFDKAAGIASWTLHDLRRTLRTRWAELGISREVAERYINHISGVHSGIEAVYDRYSYMPEMRAAVVRWEQHLSRLLAS